MDYRVLLKEENEAVKERAQLAAERIREIASGKNEKVEGELGKYFKTVAAFLEKCDAIYAAVSDGILDRCTLEDLQRENRKFYGEIFPENYEASYANPAYAVKTLGEEYGRILSFLYTELRSERVFCFEQNLEKITILNELFIEIYCMFERGDVSYHQVKDVIYWFLYDYADAWMGWRVREMLDPSLSFASDIVMGADLSDIRYLYSYGEYISENEIRMAQYLSSLPQKEIDEIAFTFTDGYREGFALKNVDLSRKKTVNIRYNIGFERIIRAAVYQFRELGLEPVIYRAAVNTLNKRQNLKVGYVSSNPNEQYDYDHRFDDAIYFDKRMLDRKLTCMRKAYEEFADEAEGFAGPACFEVFGEIPFEPESKPEAYRLSERQQNLKAEYAAESNALINEFINQDERSFTIIAYPLPSIGEKFEEIFEEVRKVNNLDKEKYKEIQQNMIQVLDRSAFVKIMGRGSNMTNLTIALTDLEDPETQTKFENCLADVNIPVGEVFTSPRLKGTSGLLHVNNVYLNGLCYKNLRLQFEDGMVTEYSCDNFPDEEEGKKFIKENLLFNRETLPMGEFAIGTNTTAYVMAAKYDIMSKLPILIAEKMGPHVALGDTCYSYSEEVRVFNPDGKEIISKDNECSILRKENPKKAYFNCHTDITIPYEALGRIVAVNKERVEVPIILDGRFVLDGTLRLNDPFQNEEEEELDIEGTSSEMLEEILVED
ncbi:leucyl aminopeptidase [Eubacterium sp. An11]|uniref:aminopeptidase n=1 Tax=Eubacterium sp. An11 TaxID=1965542 RepID=UPI000B380093|nr:aminopeptidase [Eubacterium sp. An11]OUQ66093.1 leucyl aminopeptidase [Eubacterium sp. An11]